MLQQSLIVGLSVGISMFLCGLLVVVYLFLQRKRSRSQELLGNMDNLVYIEDPGAFDDHREWEDGYSQQYSEPLPPMA